MGGPSDAQRFAALWEQYASRVQAYAARRVGMDDAQEVVSETFLVAWRRLADVPGDPLPWLLVVARNTIANHRRSTYRRRALEAELFRIAPLIRGAEAPDVSVHEREALVGALASLTPREREALFLIGWDGLSSADAARVAGCTLTAFRMRLSRARRRLTQAAADAASGPDPDETTIGLSPINLPLSEQQR